MTAQSPQSPAIEQCFSVQQIARAWQVGPQLVRKLFRNRPGVMSLGSGPRASWRIPAWLVAKVMMELGYAPKQAEQVLKVLEASDEC